MWWRLERKIGFNIFVLHMLSLLSLLVVYNESSMLGSNSYHLANVEPFVGIKIPDSQSIEGLSKQAQSINFVSSFQTFSLP